MHLSLSLFVNQLSRGSTVCLKPSPVLSDVFNEAHDAYPSVEFLQGKIHPEKLLSQLCKQG